MKIFSWMQNKLSGKHDNKKTNSISVDHHIRLESCKEEFSGWPHELLAIGTFGNTATIKEDSERNQLQEIYPCSSQNHPQELTPEQVGKLRKKDGLTDGAESESTDFLDSQTSLEDDRTHCCDEPDIKNCCGGLLQASSSTVVPGRRKDVRADNSNTAINKKSLSFLVKKMFICGSGFSPSPSLRNQAPDQSRMEKMLRAILQKKIYPQNPSPMSSGKRYLDSSIQKEPDSASDSEDEKADKGSKWVKTDSEYIVLEI